MDRTIDGHAVSGRRAHVVSSPADRSSASRAELDLCASTIQWLRALLDPTNETAVEAVAEAICPGDYCEAHSECRRDAAGALAALARLAGQPTNQEGTE